MVERILEKIKEMGLSCSAVEKKLGFGNGAIKRFETSSPSVDKIEKLSNFLNVSLDWLIKGKSQDSLSVLTANEKEFLQILNKLELETDQAKLIGYADCYADKILNDKLTAMHPNSDKKYKPEIAAYGGGKVEAEPLSEIEMIEIAQKFDDM